MSDATAAVYCRISSDPTGLRAGVERQEADCRALASREGLEVVEVYTDNDLSAFSGKPRPAYRALLEAIRERRVGVVVAWHPDRLHRSPVDLEEFIDVLNTAGATVATVQTGAVDLSTPSGRLVARQLGAVARYESEHRAERIRRKHLQLAEEGKISGGGTRPYGYERDRRTVREDEAARIREAYEHVRSGGTLIGLAARWAREAVPTVTGRPWRTQTLKRMLTSPRIAGLREHNGAIAGPAEWPAVVDRDAWDEVRAILGPVPRGRGTGSGFPRSYLLTGFAVCGLCGARLVARPRPGGVRAYVCASGPNFSGCGKIRRTAEPVEDLVRDLVLEVLDGPGLASALRARAGDDAEAHELAEDLRTYQGRLERLREEYAVDDMWSADEFRQMRAKLERHVEDAQTALARRTSRLTATTLPISSDGLRGAWEAADLDRRRALVGLVVEKVIVHPARRGLNRFDPDRIEVTWH